MSTPLNIGTVGARPSVQDHRTMKGTTMTNPARTAAERAPGDTSANIGSIRVAMTAMILTTIAFVVGTLTDRTVDVTDPIVIAVAPVVFGAIYRASRALAARWPVLAPVLFVVPAEPVYDADN